MKKLIKNLSVLFLALFCTTNLAFASETNGSINPGLSTGIEGTVVVAPIANVPAGTYTSVQNVSLAAIGSQSVHYTINGDNPDCSSVVYSSPIVISLNSTLKAIACYENNITSSISSFVYVINLPQYPVPLANPLPGTYPSAQSIVLTAEGSTSIHYVTDDSALDCSNGTVYTTAISVGSSQTIRAIACYEGDHHSTVASFVYEINYPPLVNPLPGTYPSAQSIVLTAEGSTSIHYVTDDSALDCSNGTVYTTAISVGSSQTIRAIACYADDNSSVVVSFAYIISTAGGISYGGGGTPPPVAIVGDLDNNSKIDFLDFNILMINWGATGSNAADLNHDNVVDFFDFNILMINWGK
jgi:hypothetical protein